MKSLCMSRAVRQPEVVQMVRGPMARRWLMAVAVAVGVGVGVGLGGPCARAEPPASVAALPLVSGNPSGNPSGNASGDPSTASDYRIGAGDGLRIVVYQNPDLSLEQRVQDDGHLTYPLLGALPVQGLTVRQLEQRIEQGLRDGGYLRQPQVVILLAQVRAHQISVLGQVQRPGRYPLDQPGLRLTELLAQAGGLTATGAERIILTGRREGRAWRHEVDLPALFTPQASPQDDLLVHSGDVVFVDRAPLVYVYGEVQRPGALRLERGMTVLQALAAGGGPTLRGTVRGLRLTRHASPDDASARPGPRTRVPSLHDRLEPGDVLHVPESLF